MSFFRRNSPVSAPPVGAMSDAALVIAARAGRKDAFVEIVTRFQPLVCAVAYERTGNFQAGEDVAQETFVTAWRKIGELRDPGKLRPWLLRIAGALAVDYLRRDKASRREPLTIETDLASTADPPDEAAAGREEEALVWSTLESLPESCRLPLILHYREGQSAAQIAAALELSEEAVRQRLSRGRDLLREKVSGLIEGVLRRRIPSALFVMTVAASIGALTAPAVLAAGAFSAGTATAAPAAAIRQTNTHSLLVAMKASKTTLAAAALVVISIPAVYFASGPGAADEESAGVRSRAAFASRPALKQTGDRADQKAKTSGLTTDEWMASLRKSLNEPSEPRRKMRWSLLLEDMTAESAPEVRKLFDEFERDGRSYGDEAAAFWARWGELDGAAALAAVVAGGYPDVRLRKEAISGWARTDSRAAIAWIKTAGPDLVGRGPMLRGMMASLGHTDPDQAVAFLTREISPGEQRALTKEAVWGVLYTGGRGATAEFIEKLVASGSASPEMIRDSVFVLLQSSIRGGPMEAQGVVERFKGQPWCDTVTLEAAFNKVSEKGVPRGVLESVHLLTDPAAQQHVIEKAIARWTKLEPNTVGDWLNQNRANPAYDAIVAGYAETVRQLDPEAAITWAGTINDPVRRKAVISRIGEAR